MSPKILLSACTAIVGASFAISLTTTSTGAPPPTDEQLLSQAVPAMSSPKVAADELPANSKEELTQGPESRFGIDPERSRLLKQADGHRLFAAAGSSSVCLVRVADDAVDRQIACSDASDAARKPTWVAGPEGSGYRVFGSTPAATSSLSLTLADGTTLPVAVRRGGFDLTTQSAPATLDYVGAGDSGSFPVGLPPSAGPR